MKTVAIIQARMGSSRFPGKMMQLINNKPIIWYVIDSVKQVKLIDKIVLASTKNKEDQILLEKAKEYGIGGFAGNENDVLDRYYQCAKKFRADIILRVTGDCPLVDPEVIEKVIKMFQDNECDYCSNTLPPTYPDGLDVEVFSFKTLETAWKESKTQKDREHVTSYIRVGENEKKFKKLNLENGEDLSHIRLTLDQKEDFILIKKIFERINKNPIYLKDIIDLIKKDPELLQINNQFERNNGEIR